MTIKLINFINLIKNLIKALLTDPSNHSSFCCSKLAGIKMAVFNSNCGMKLHLDQAGKSLRAPIRKKESMLYRHISFI